MADRPELSSAMSESEFGRWYWTMAELQPFARACGLSASGPKAELAGRIAAHLAGRPERPSTRSARPPSAQLTGELSRSTPIPRGQRSTSHLRAFFTDEVGPSFRFNGHMRAFLAAGAGTLGDAVDHWYATVGTELPRQSTSLEFNRFTRLWHRSHPDGSAEECRKAWSTYRNLPVDQRPPIGEI